MYFLCELFVLFTPRHWVLWICGMSLTGMRHLILASLELPEAALVGQVSFASLPALSARVTRLIPSTDVRETRPKFCCQGHKGHVYHRPLNFIITPDPVTLIWLKTHFRSTSNVIEGNQENKHLLALLASQTSQSSFLLKICVFISNFSLSVCSSQTLALMSWL